MTNRTSTAVLLAWFMAAVVLLTLAFACGGCAVRQPLDLTTAQVINLARREMTSAAQAWDQDVAEADQAKLSSAMQAAKARIKANPDSVDETFAAVEAATHKYNRMRQAASQRLANFTGYAEMLREVEASYMSLYNRTNSLKAMFTGHPAPELTLPDGPAGTPPDPQPK